MHRIQVESWPMCANQVQRDSPTWAIIHKKYVILRVIPIDQICLQNVPMNAWERRACSHECSLHDGSLVDCLLSCLRNTTLSIGTQYLKKNTARSDERTIGHNHSPGSQDNRESRSSSQIHNVQKSFWSISIFGSTLCASPLIPTTWMRCQVPVYKGEVEFGCNNMKIGVTYPRLGVYR